VKPRAASDFWTNASYAFQLLPMPNTFRVVTKTTSSLHSLAHLLPLTYHKRTHIYILDPRLVPPNTTPPKLMQVHTYNPFTAGPTFQTTHVVAQLPGAEEKNRRKARVKGGWDFSTRSLHGRCGVSRAPREMYSWYRDI
jgi:hypothetical protein